VNEGLIAAQERRALRWLAARMPEGVTPDLLTGLGFAASVLILAAYALTNVSPAFLWLASAGFVLNWFGDSLDGTLARYRKIERPRYGYFVDHAVDSVNMLLVGLGLGLSPFVRLDYALLAICGYLMMSVLTYITTHVRGVFQLSYGRLGPTEVRLAIIGINTLIYAVGNPELDLGLARLALFDAITLGIGVGLVALFVVSAWRQASQLSAVDRPAPR
jgi:phosphatidylglycerophosphate synthase